MQTLISEHEECKASAYRAVGVSQEECLRLPVCNASLVSLLHR